MKSAIFRRWDWQFDRGIEMIDRIDAGSGSFAMAYYDWKDRLYRVEKFEARDQEGIESQIGYCKYVYDYFCDASGRVIQKRALNDDGSVDLIVDLAYDDVSNTVHETAWSPANEGSNQIVRRQAE